jgi:hypothetical protein
MARVAPPTAVALLLVLSGLLLLPGGALGKTVTYKGKIIGGVDELSGSPGGGAVEFRVKFKGKPKRGKPKQVGFVQVHQPPWVCPKDYPSQPDATGDRLPQNQKVRFGEWASLGQAGLWTRVDKARQFELGTPPVFDEETTEDPFRDHYLDGAFHGKTAQKAKGYLDLAFGELAPTPDESWYPGNTDEYYCLVQHKWTAKRQ